MVYNARMKTINVRLDYALYLELVKLRDQIGVPVTESLRRSVREYLAKQAKQASVDPQSVQVQNLPE